MWKLILIVQTKTETRTKWQLKYIEREHIVYNMVYVKTNTIEQQNYIRSKWKKINKQPNKIINVIKSVTVRKCYQKQKSHNQTEAYHSFEKILKWQIKQMLEKKI